jgi:hypothetical protein
MILHVRTEKRGLITVPVQACDAVGTLKVKLFQLTGTAPEQQFLFHSYMDQLLLDNFSFISNSLESGDALTLRVVPLKAPVLPDEAEVQ